MSRPRRKTLAPVAAVPEGASASSGGPAMSEVLVLTECLINGTRHQPFTRTHIPADRVEALTAVGWVLPNDVLQQMPAFARDQWLRDVRPRAIANEALCATPEQIDALWQEQGRILTPDHVPSSYTPAPVEPGALRVLNLTTYDPGSSVYRYHSAANTVPGIVSAFARWGYSNPHTHLRQWDGVSHRRTVELLAYTADVIHVHMDYRVLFDDLRWAPLPHQRVAITYHGSLLPGDPRVTYRDEAADARHNAIVFGARPYHFRHGVPYWLPIPMPVDDYHALRAAAVRPETRRFRVAHSPTKREIKGTREFLDACVYVTEHLGIPIEPVLIEDMAHGEGLALKATCDAVFDSFWLGIQGSGLEGAAMGLPVIAGDPGAVADLERYDLPCPWTFADNTAQLREQLARLAREPGYRAQEAARVHAYARAWHDYPVVGQAYADILHRTVRGTRGATNGR